MAVEGFSGSVVKITADVKDLLNAGRKFEQIQKQIRFAQSNAVNRLSTKLKNEHKALMTKVFDKPTPFTLNSLFIQKADRRQDIPEAKLFFKTFATKGTPAGKYLQAQIFGGSRVKKSHERQLMFLRQANATGTFTVPRRSERDQYGNMKGGRYNKIISQLKVNRDATQNATGSRRSRSRRRGETFFILQSKYNAIFSRTSKTSIKPILYLKQNSPNYRQRYQYFEFSQQYWDKNIVGEFDKAWGEALATAQWK